MSMPSRIMVVWRPSGGPARAAQLIEEQQGLSVCAEAGREREALAAPQEKAPEMVHSALRRVLERRHTQRVATGQVRDPKGPGHERR